MNIDSMILWVGLIFGLTMTVLGGYFYHKIQSKEDIKHSHSSRAKLQGSTHLLVFGLIISALIINFIFS